MKKFSFCLAAAALVCTAADRMQQCSAVQQRGQRRSSGAPTGDISAPAEAGRARTRPLHSFGCVLFASAPAATEYGSSGTWVVEATKEGDIPSLNAWNSCDGDWFITISPAVKLGKAAMAGTARTSWNIPLLPENRRRGHGPAGRGRVYGDHPAGIMKAARPPECSAIKEQKQGAQTELPLLFQCFFAVKAGVLLCLRRACGFARFRQR